MMQRFKPVQVLLVEDNADDVEITQRALRRGATISEFSVARDGAEVLELLFDGAGDPDGPAPARPDFILLDINLPKIDGFDVLGRIRASDRLSTMPVVMLTASGREEDVDRSYRLGANSYIQKPVVFERFREILDALGRYWFEVATLPSATSVEETRR